MEIKYENTISIQFDDLADHVPTCCRIVMVINYFPPFSVLSGDRAGEGVVEKLVILLEKEFPDMKIILVQANISRLLDEFRSGEKGIDATLRNTLEREAFTSYSNPI